jgi:hypothetical protein
MSNKVKNTEVFVCPFSVSISDVRGNVQMEVTDLQCNSGLRGK